MLSWLTANSENTAYQFLKLSSDFENMPKSENPGGSGFILACKDFGRMFDHSFPAWAVFFSFLLLFCFSGD